MTGKGRIASAPNRLTRWLVAAHVIWFGLICALVLWWESLLRGQAAKLARFEHLAGVPEAEQNWQRIQRILYWESPVFFVLLFLSAGVLIWLYARDAKRTRGLQAFFASVTHELRTPLTSIRLQAESISEVIGPSDERTRHLVARLLEDTMRLEGQVERTLELARVEGGGKVYLEPVRLKPWIERMSQGWAEAYAGQVSLDNRLQGEDLAIEADPAALQVVLKNLLENSLRHSREGGSQQPIRVELSADPGSSEVTVRFRDFGRGYPGEARKLGKLFQKGPGSQGAGVGLYLVKTLMKRMGGDIELANADGGGFAANLVFRRAHG